MPFRTHGSRRQGQVRNRTGRRRRRTSLRARAKWQKPSARNQRSQIRTLANIALRNQKILKAQRAICDWVLTGTNTFNAQSTQFSLQLMSPASWTATMRKNSEASKSQRTYVRNMTFSYFLNGEALTDPCQVSMFIVSLRPTSADWAGTFTENTEWANQGFRNMPILNSNIFKVHWCRQFQIFPEQVSLASGDATSYGNPNTITKRGKVRIKAGYNIVAPAGSNWTSLTQEDLPPHRRLYVIVFPQTIGSPTPTASLNWGLAVTTVNSD